MIRHFTATGFVVKGDAVLLHWHAKIRAWLPPGGHVEPNEDPVQGVLREIKEETGLSAEIVGSAPELGLDYPEQVAPPYTIMVEDIDDPVDGFHQHIDMIYFCRPVDPVAPLRTGWRWVTRRDLADSVALAGPDGLAEPPPRDVRVLAERAFKALGRS
jgi:8-oxo-dGTP pyrophosphatase MutT (NUDIX family)